jgi:hypothetical protein
VWYTFLLMVDLISDFTLFCLIWQFMFIVVAVNLFPCRFLFFCVGVFCGFSGVYF